MSKKLGIKGHETRGKEVIELLEMMGGINSNEAYGNLPNNWDVSYYIFKDGVINVSEDKILTKKQFKIFTLEEFFEKYPFKVGDKVMRKHGGDLLTIKSMEWSEDCETMVYDFKDSVIVLAAEDLLKYNAVETKSCTVSLKDDKAIGNSIDSVQIIQSGKVVAVRFNTQNYENEVELQLDDYEIVVRDGKTYAVRKKPKYPTTYAECCEVLVGRKPKPNEISFDKMELCLVDLDNTQSIDFQNPYLPQFNSLFKLRMCRDAYWKIYGEETGLGKPWKPDWNEETNKFTISNKCNKIYLNNTAWYAEVLSFPTAEMRDAFFKNFKKEIEQCKELL